MIKFDKKTACAGCATVRTFIAFSNFFLFFEVFLPVEYFSIRSLADVPSVWAKQNTRSQKTKMAECVPLCSSSTLR